MSLSPYLSSFGFLLSMALLNNNNRKVKTNLTFLTTLAWFFYGVRYNDHKVMVICFCFIIVVFITTTRTPVV